MSLLIKGMTMPTTGLYFVGVDNTNGKDKTVVTVERMLGNSDVRQIIGSFELTPVPPHGRLIDADALIRQMDQRVEETNNVRYAWVDAMDISFADTIIEAEGE